MQMPDNLKVLKFEATLTARPVENISVEFRTIDDIAMKAMKMIGPVVFIRIECRTKDGITLEAQKTASSIEKNLNRRP